MKKLMTALCALTSVAAVAEIEIASPEAAEQNAELHWTPLELNLASPVVSFPWWDRDVYGLKLNFAYGSAAKVYGVDFGVVSRNVGETYGLQANGFNWNSERVVGVQAGVLANVDYKGFAGIQLAGAAVNDLDASAGIVAAPFVFTTGFDGWQIGAFNWEFASMDGFQLGAVNESAGVFRGLELGAINWNRREFTGLQLGLINCIQGTATGVQIGVFNGADSLTGFQLGLFNFNATAPLPLMIVANGSF